ncbi:hypothetical protein LMG28688_06949 [Paraburkholderia caffeinitolerans]|uniref:Acid shock protein n=1 Tax=Paraburkholderia caffeinitolerans TaxID=1723730 RepID=A0A6J5GZX7_9BURK|nr:hypothetical protein [Paraburkholderia caffeinitolerans]CAB3809221.1 hypothetical protein LMG28688_06949 [Paraburkholderia caffeinitolerans]
MKLSKYLLLMALTLSAASHAQTSQTYHFGEGQTGFGEGQSTPQHARTSSPPPLPGAGPTQPLPPGEPHSQAKPKAKPKAKSKSKYKTHHRHHTTHHAPVQDPYSRP